MQIAMTDRMAKYRARWAALAAAAVFLLCLCGCMGRAAATEFLQAAGYEDVTLRKDLRGVVRAVSAKKPEV